MRVLVRCGRPGSRMNMYAHAGCSARIRACVRAEGIAISRIMCVYYTSQQAKKTNTSVSKENILSTGGLTGAVRVCLSSLFPPRLFISPSLFLSSRLWIGSHIEEWGC